MKGLTTRIGALVLLLTSAAQASPDGQAHLRDLREREQRERDRWRERDDRMNCRHGHGSHPGPNHPPDDYWLGEAVPPRGNATMTLAKPAGSSTKCLTDNATGTAFGKYASGSKTCTLKSDVVITPGPDGDTFTTIQVVSDNITLDCNGHSISGSALGAFSLDFRDYVTIKNCVFPDGAALNVSGGVGGSDGLDYYGASEALTFTGNTVRFPDSSFYQTAVFISGVAQTPFHDFRVNDNRFIATTVSGFSGNRAMHAGETRRLRYEDNVIVNVPSGDSVSMSFDPVLAGNRYTFDVSQAARQDVIHLDTVDHPVLRDNTITGFSGPVLSAYGTLNALVERNLIQRYGTGPDDSNPPNVAALTPGYVSFSTVIRNNTILGAPVGLEINGVAAQIYGNRIEGSRYADLTLSHDFINLIEGNELGTSDPAGNQLTFITSCATISVHDNDLTGRAEFVWVNTPGARVQARPNQELAGVALCGAHGARVSGILTEALYVSNTNGATLTDVRVSDSAISPGKPGRLAEPHELQVTYSNNNTFTRVTVSGNGSAFPYLDPLDAANNSSVLVLTSDGNTFDRLKVTGNAWSGASFQTTVGTTVKNSDLSGNAGDGLSVQDADSFVLQDSTLNGNAGHGLEVRAFTSSSTFKNLVVHDNAGGDVDFSPGSCSNEVTNVSTTANAPGFVFTDQPVHLSGGTYSTILLCGGSGSTIDGVTAAAVQLNDLDHAIVSDVHATSILFNNVNDSQVTGSTSTELFLTGSSNNVIAGNTIVSGENDFGAFNLYLDFFSSNNQVLDNEIAGRSTAAIVQGTGNLFDGNTIGVSFSGIVITGTATDLRNNRVCDSAADWSILNYGTDTMGDDNTCTGTQNYRDASAAPDGYCRFSCLP